MLDIRLIRQDADRVKQAMRNRQNEMDRVIDEILQIDQQRRELSAQNDQMRAEQNKVTKQIPVLKKQGEDISKLLQEMKELSDRIAAGSVEQTRLEARQRELLLSVPNVPSDTVPVGVDENDNPEIRRFMEPTQFAFEPQPHWDIGKKLGILDPETAAKVTGSRFHFYRGLGAKLERAVISFFLDTHTQHGYTEVMPPYMVNRASMTGTGQLPKFEEDAFKIDGMDYFLIPTAEVPVTNIYRDDILSGADLPIKYCAYSACFRSEAGSAGRDERGLIRQHQFNKVELVKFVRPEESYQELEALTHDAERVLQLLELPYRVICLCTGDLGFSSAKTYDIEVWLPSYQAYKEISSCSNFEDYQARRANIRFKDNVKAKTQLVHTLNGSGLAVGRTVAAILENYQNDDGTVRVPKALVPYMGCDVIR